MMPPILIIPGLNGSGPHHWQTCLERSFRGARRVQQADWKRPNRAAWVERIVADIEANPGSALVAHSLGCALVAHVAAERPDRHTPQRLRGFAPIPRAPLRFRSVVVASTNDPYMALPRARELADAWGAAFVEAGLIGHINVEAGFGPWPAGERILRDLMLGRRESRSTARATLDA